jgi:hypothetical protein
MGTTAVEVESPGATPSPAVVRAAAVELVEKLEQASAARKAAMEAAERLDGLAQQARFPRLAIPVWNEANGIREDLSQDEVTPEAALETVREFVDLLDLASKEVD